MARTRRSREFRGLPRPPPCDHLPEPNRHLRAGCHGIAAWRARTEPKLPSETFALPALLIGIANGWRSQTDLRVRYPPSDRVLLTERVLPPQPSQGLVAEGAPIGSTDHRTDGPGGAGRMRRRLSESLGPRARRSDEPTRSPPLPRAPRRGWRRRPPAPRSTRSPRQTHRPAGGGRAPSRRRRR